MSVGISFIFVFYFLRVVIYCFFFFSVRITRAARWRGIFARICAWRVVCGIGVVCITRGVRRCCRSIGAVGSLFLSLKRRFSLVFRRLVCWRVRSRRAVRTFWRSSCFCWWSGRLGAFWVWSCFVVVWARCGRGVVVRVGVVSSLVCGFCCSRRSSFF